MSEGSSQGQGAGRAAEAAPQGMQVAHVRSALNRLIALGTFLHQGDLPEERARTLIESFAQHLEDALAEGLPLAVEVEATGAWFGGIEVAGGNPVSRVMVERLYRAGLRGIFVQEGASRQELARLGRVLTVPWRAEGEALDPAQWEVGFDHVFLDLDTRREVEQVEAEPADCAAAVRRLVQELGEGVVTLDGEALEARIAELVELLATTPPGGGTDGRARSLRLTQAGQDLLAAFDGFDEGLDVPVERLGMVVFETIREDPAPVGAVSTTRSALALVKACVEAGRPDDAMDLLRRLVLLVDRTLFDDFEHGHLVRQELQVLFGPPFRESILQGWRHRPDPKVWAGPLFTLAQVAGMEQVDALLALGCALPVRELRQSVADALLLTASAAGLSPRDLLKVGTEEQACVVLLALARVADPTLVEPLLARAGSTDAAVREAVLVALRGHQSPRIKAVMRAAIADVSKEVRLEALRYLTVYHDGEAVPSILARLVSGGLDAGELLALVKAVLLIDRETGVERLRAIVAKQRGALDRAVLHAILNGLLSVGDAGKRALDSLGRAHPELRADLRAVMGQKA